MFEQSFRDKSTVLIVKHLTVIYYILYNAAEKRNRAAAQFILFNTSQFN